MLSLVLYRFGRRQTQHHSFYRQQPSWLQWIALQRHCQRENKLDDQRPARNDRTQGKDYEWVDRQKAQDSQLVPSRGVTQKILNEGAAQ